MNASDCMRGGDDGESSPLALRPELAAHELLDALSPSEALRAAAVEVCVRLNTHAEVLDAYLARTPLSHAIFRAAEVKALGNMDFRRPILEVGCGTGQFAQFALNAPVDMGVDVAKGALRRAARCRAYRRLVRADAHFLPFGAGEFQTVLCISVLEHIPHAQGVVDEIFRVLTPGGRAIVTVVLSDLHRELFYARLCEHAGLPKLGRLYRRLQDWAFRHVTMLPHDDWERMFRDAGFRLEHVRRCVSARAAVWWDLLLALAWPYRLAEALGIRCVWRPHWLRRRLARCVERLACGGDETGVCLAIAAQKPAACPGYARSDGNHPLACVMATPADL